MIFNGYRIEIERFSSRSIVRTIIILTRYLSKSKILEHCFIEC